MTINPSTGLVSMQTANLALRGIHSLQNVQVFITGFESRQTEANLIVNILTCDDSTISVPSLSPFAPAFHTYTTFDTTLPVNFPNESDLVVFNFPLDCGPFVLSWDQTLSPTSSDLDITVFTLDDPARKISVYTEDSSKTGTYFMSYTVSLSLYSSVVSERLGDAF